MFKFEDELKSIFQKLTRENPYIALELLSSQNRCGKKKVCGVISTKVWWGFVDRYNTGAGEKGGAEGQQAHQLGDGLLCLGTSENPDIPSYSISKSKL